MLCTMCISGFRGGPKRALFDSLRLELQMDVNHHGDWMLGNKLRSSGVFVNSPVIQILEYL